jgi:hypothetical protein
MRLQALTGPCETTEGFGAATTMRKAIGVLGLDCQGLHAISLGRKDVDDVNIKFLTYPNTLPR